MTVAEIPQSTRKILKEITGEKELDDAVKSSLKDTVKHKLSKVREKIEGYEEKYGTDFEDFKTKWHNGKIKDKHSYATEKDYLEWEALETRKEKLVEAFQWLE